MKENSRRKFLKCAGIGAAAFCLPAAAMPVTLLPGGYGQQGNGPAGLAGNGVDRKIFFTTGFKVTEVTRNTAIVWTRLCGAEKPKPVRHKRREAVFRHPIDFDEGQPVPDMDGAVPGTEGQVRIILSGGGKQLPSAWRQTKAGEDFTVQVPFYGLDPECYYEVLVEARKVEKGRVYRTSGTFRTLPEEDSILPVTLVSSTCQYFWSYDDEERGFRTYDSMGKLNPDFFIHTGDYVYYDKPGPLATTIEKARHKWHAMDSRPSLVDFFKSTPVYLQKDDHDLLKNDVDPTSSPYGELTYEEGLKIWHENVPVRDQPYRTFRVTQDLQIWLVEGREYRSPNKSPDGKDKTIWGEAQKDWFRKTVEGSDATFKLLFSPTPIVGPDRVQKVDNHANAAFETEGAWLRSYLAGQKNLFVVNGDRHWQYVSRDDETGLMEFGSGPVSDYHAQGWDPGKVLPEHRFLRVKGGFICVKVFREAGQPTIAFTHYDVDGHVVHEEKFS